jgi:hypothetical protein
MQRAIKKHHYSATGHENYLRLNFEHDWWMVGMCRPSNTLRIAYELDKVGAVCYLPCVQERRRIPRTKQYEKKILPLWPGRVFISSSSLMFRASIKFSLMIFNEQIVQIDSKSLSLFHDVPKPTDIKADDKVFVRDGVLKGLYMKVLHCHNEKATCEHDSGSIFIINTFHLDKMER